MAQFDGQAAQAESAVIAGVDVILTQDNKLINAATDVAVSQDFQTMGVRFLGYHGDRDFKSLGYAANIDIGTYLFAEPGLPGTINIAGYQADGKFNLNKIGYFDFVITDIVNNIILQTCVQCKMNTQNDNYPNNDFVSRRLNWKTRAVLPGIQTS